MVLVAAGLVDQTSAFTFDQRLTFAEYVLLNKKAVRQSVTKDS